MARSRFSWIRSSWAASTVFLLACAGPPKAGEDLLATLNAYNDDIRWKRFDRAELWVAEDFAKTFAERRTRDEEELNLENLEVRSVRFVDDDSAEVTIRVSWMRNPSVTMHNDTLTQLWRRKQGLWQLSSQTGDWALAEEEEKPEEPPAPPVSNEPPAGFGVPDD